MLHKQALSFMLRQEKQRKSLQNFLPVSTRSMVRIRSNSNSYRTWPLLQHVYSTCSCRHSQSHKSFLSTKPSRHDSSSLLHSRKNNNCYSNRGSCHSPVIARHRCMSSSSSSTSSYSSSVSNEEISKFSSQSKTWWDTSRNPLIGMNPIRVRYIVETLRSHHRLLVSNESDKKNPPPLHGLRVLDVGCGGGLLSESLARLGANVTAIDPSVDIVEVAKTKQQQQQQQQQKQSLVQRHQSSDDAEGFAGNQINYRGGISIEELADELLVKIGEDDNENEKKQQEEQSKHLFDVICILEVIEHTTNPQSLLQAASLLLRRPNNGTGRPLTTGDDDSGSGGGGGGMIFLSTINRTIKSFLLGIVGAEYITQQIPMGTHTYEKFCTPNEVRTLMSNVGLDEVDVCGMVFEPPSPLDLLCGQASNLKWKLDRMDSDMNWIGAYEHMERKQE